MAGGRQGAPGFDPARLRAARQAAGLSQGALARAVEVHENSVFEWEAGRQVPRIETVAALARALHLSPLELLEHAEDQAFTLQHLRVVAGKSQQQVATEAGMLRTTYSAIERGETVNLSATDAAALAGALSTAGATDALTVTDEQVRTAQAASRSTYLERHPRPNGRGRRHRGHE